MPSTFPHLGDIPEDVARHAMPGIVEAAAEVAQGEAPERKGKLRASIRGIVLPGGLSGAVQATARHAHLVHDGTKSHGTIRPRSKKALTVPTAGGIVVRATSEHIGIAANPFLDRTPAKAAGEVERLLADAAEQVLGAV